ncbi:MAG: sugar phosphate isomerase/epimerase family protein [Limisphaerales bacterium]|jgi:sugar phosphate isomerase/epimerase
MNQNGTLSRRAFLKTTALTISSFALVNPELKSAQPTQQPTIAIFSKIYQELKLDFEESAELTAAADYDGVDTPVREKGEIEPARAAEDLPRYAEALAKRGKKILLLTSGILGIESPHAETVLKTAKKLGVKYYRLGMDYHNDKEPLQKQLDRKKEQLKELAKLNRKIGVTAIFQNHSPAGNRIYIGGDLDEMHYLVKDFDPDDIGIAFDLGHAIVVHGDEWRKKFDLIKSHFKIAYIKDVRRPRSFVPFGEGEFSKSGFFGLLKKMNYNEPFSIHIEFDFAGKGNSKTKEALLKTMVNCREALKKWINEA